MQCRMKGVVVPVLLELGILLRPQDLQSTSSSNGYKPNEEVNFGIANTIARENMARRSIGLLNIASTLKPDRGYIVIHMSEKVIQRNNLPFRSLAPELV